jgi:hypothetical protein
VSSLAATIERIRAGGRIRPEAVLALRGLVFGQIEVTPEEAEALIGLDEAVEEACPEWRDFFIEALTEHVVRQQTPSGYVDDAKAKWLVDRIGRDGRLKTETELGLLVKVLETADSVPDSLTAFAIFQVTRAVLDGDGRIDAEEVEYLRRVIFAGGGPNGLGVSRAEAAALFDLNDAVRGKANDPAWTDLFVKGVANAILVSAGYQAPSREEAMRREAWLAAPSDGVFAFFGRMAGAAVSPRALRSAFQSPEAEDLWFEASSQAEADRALAALISGDEAAWLVARIGRDGAFDDNERALLAFLEAEAPDLHPLLQPLAARAAA